MLENSPEGNRNCQENKTSSDKPCLHVSLSAISVQFPNSERKSNTENHKINRNHHRSQPAPKISAITVSTAAARTTQAARHCPGMLSSFVISLIPCFARIKSFLSTFCKQLFLHSASLSIAEISS